MADEEKKKEEVVEDTKTEEPEAPAEEEKSIDTPVEEPKEDKAPAKEESKPEKKAEKKAAAEEKPAPVKEEPKAEKAPAEEKKPEAPAGKKDEAPKAKPEKKEKAEKAPKPEKAEEPEPAEDKKEEKPVDKKPAKEDKPAEKKEEKAAEEKPKGPKKPVGLPPEKVLLFGKYNMAEVVVHDPGLQRYLNLDPIIVAHTGARHANRSFGKTKMHIIERLVNNMMRTEKYTGKKTKSYRVVKEAFEIIEKKTKTHPVQILIDAIENSAPREEITRLRYGGVSVPKAVDTSASRRLDLAFRNIAKGAVNSSYKSAKSIEMCLANELMLAAKKDMNSFAVSKKEELERVAASAR